MGFFPSKKAPGQGAAVRFRDPSFGIPAKLGRPRDLKAGGLHLVGFRLGKRHLDRVPRCVLGIRKSKFPQNRVARETSKRGRSALRGSPYEKGIWIGCRRAF